MQKPDKAFYPYYEDRYPATSSGKNKFQKIKKPHGKNFAFEVRFSEYQFFSLMCRKSNVPEKSEPLEYQNVLRPAVEVSTLKQSQTSARDSTQKSESQIVKKEFGHSFSNKVPNILGKNLS